MSANLCIDWGNTRIKVAIFNNEDQLIDMKVFSEDGIREGLIEVFAEYKPAKGILCSVTENSVAIEPFLKENMRAVVIMNNNTPVPIMNAYSSPGTLGADRVAMAVAAYFANPDKNNLVICLGTCITYNFVQKNKAFRGGAISPGLRMRLQAMHHFTSKLPDVKAEGDLLLLGYDTDTCMRSGAVFGMAAEIDGILSEYASQYPDFNAVLTGGDVPFFDGKLKSKIFADPNLLMKGLNIILKHNAPHIR
ncbi:MAG TPA: type III pantothenate kinase [Flavipsychrobacter sp.]|nr:type III pantothenate kinase [Flavipsychrobacter sp.]